VRWTLATVGGIVAAAFAVAYTDARAGESIEYAGITLAIYVTFAGLLTAVGLVILVCARRFSASTAAFVAVFALLLTFPIDRNWFEDEWAGGQVPFAQWLVLEVTPDAEQQGRPLLYYNEVCCG